MYRVPNKGKQGGKSEYFYMRGKKGFENMISRGTSGALVDSGMYLVVY